MSELNRKIYTHTLYYCPKGMDAARAQQMKDGHEQVVIATREDIGHVILAPKEFTFPPEATNDLKSRPLMEFEFSTITQYGNDANFIRLSPPSLLAFVKDLATTLLPALLPQRYR